MLISATGGKANSSSVSRTSSGNDNSSSLRSGVASRLVNWKDSFKNFGVPFTPFGGMKPVKYDGHGQPGSFDFLEVDD